MTDMEASRKLRACAVTLLALGTVACASTGAVPRPFPMPGGGPSAGPLPPTPAVVEPHPPQAYALVGTALALRGAPYRNGGSDPQGFDCSGFTQYVFAQYGVALPRAVGEQYGIGKDVAPGELTAGDLIFFSTVAPGPSHVGIAVGGDEFVHAPSSSGVVRVERLSATYWSKRYVAARRVM